MGRPLRKDVNGVDVIGTFVSDTGVRIEFYNGTTLVEDGIILKQRGAKTFVVADKDAPGTQFTCVLQDSTPNADGEMRLWGYNPTNSGAEVNIAKITKRVATDFSQNDYTWQLVNDSSNDYIELTAV